MADSASVPAADILALADGYTATIKRQLECADIADCGCTVCEFIADLRALVDAADSPREVRLNCSPTEHAEDGYCVGQCRVAAAEQADKGEGGRPAGKSQGAASAGEPPIVADALTAPAAPVGEGPTTCATCGHGQRQHAALRWECYDCLNLDRNPPCSDFVPRVPVNDEAEALRAERDAYRDQSDEDQKARGRLVMELDTLRELASAYLAVWGGGIPKLWLDAFTALGIEPMDDTQAAFDLAQSLAARGEDA